MNATSPASLLQQSAGKVAPLSRSSFSFSDGAGTSLDKNDLSTGVSPARLLSGVGTQNTSSVSTTPKSPSLAMLRARKIMGDAQKINSTAKRHGSTRSRLIPVSPTASETSSDVSSNADMETVARVSNYIDTLQSKRESAIQIRSSKSPPIGVPAIANPSRTHLLADTTTRYNSKLVHARNAMAVTSVGKKNERPRCGNIELEKKSLSSVAETFSTLSTDSSAKTGARSPVESSPLFETTHMDKVSVSRVARCEPNGDRQSGGGVTQPRSGLVPPIGIASPVLPAATDSSRTGGSTRYTSASSSAEAASTPEKKRETPGLENTKPGTAMHGESMDVTFSTKESTRNVVPSRIESSLILVTTEKAKVSESNVACSAKTDQPTSIQASIAPSLRHADTESPRTPILAGVKTTLANNAHKAKSASPAGKRNELPSHHRDNIEWRKKWNLESRDGILSTTDSPIKRSYCPMKSSPIPVITENGKASESSVARCVPSADRKANAHKAKSATPADKRSELPSRLRDNIEWRKNWNLKSKSVDGILSTANSPIEGSHCPIKSSPIPVITENDKASESSVARCEPNADRKSGDGATQTRSGLNSTRTMRYASALANAKAASTASKKRQPPCRDNIEPRKTMHDESTDETFSTKDSTGNMARSNTEPFSGSNVARCAQPDQATPTQHSNAPSLRHAVTGSSCAPVLVKSTCVKSTRNAENATIAGIERELPRRDNIEPGKTMHDESIDETISAKDSALNVAQINIESSPILSATKDDEVSELNVACSALRDQLPFPHEPPVRHAATDSSRAPVPDETTRGKPAFDNALNANSPSAAGRKNKLVRSDNIALKKTSDLEPVDGAFPTKISTLNGARFPIESSSILVTSEEGQKSESIVARRVLNGGRQVKIGPHFMKKDVNFYAVLAQIQKAVRLDNVSISLGKILADSANRGMSLDAVTEMYKFEMLKARGHRESGNGNKSYVGENILHGNSKGIKGKTRAQDEANPTPTAIGATSYTIANEDGGQEITARGHQDATTNISDKVAADMQELLRLCDEVNLLFSKSITKRNYHVASSLAVSLPSSVATNKNEMNGAQKETSVINKVQEKSSHNEILFPPSHEIRTPQKDSELVREYSEDELSIPGLTDAQLYQLTQLVNKAEEMREADLPSQVCIDEAVKQRLGCDSGTTQDVEEIDAFFSRFSIENDGEVVHRKSNETPQKKCERNVRFEDERAKENCKETPQKECERTVNRITKEQAHLDRNLLKNIAGSGSRRDPLVELSVGMNESISQGDTGINLPDNLGLWKSSLQSDGVAAPEAIYFPGTQRQCFVPREKRVACHSGYLNIDFYSLYEATAVKTEDEDIDQAPWEFRDVGQRFLHEKSLESRNWFGKFIN